MDPKHIQHHVDKVKSYIRKDLLDQSYFTDEKLTEILSATPDQFDGLVYDIESKGFDKTKLDLAFVGCDKSGTKKGTTSGYGYFSKKDKSRYTAYDLADNLDVSVCPYCNRNYTFTIRKFYNEYTRPEFDHFYNKKEYPYLALSFYNLIPSCHICNSTIKGNKDFKFSTHLHPYVDDFDERTQFRIYPMSADYLKDKNEFNLVVKSIDPFDTRTKQNIKDFALNIQYKEHRDIALETMLRAIIYPDSQLKEFLKNHPDLFENKEEVEKTVFCAPVKSSEINQRIHTKMINDIKETIRKKVL